MKIPPTFIPLEPLEISETSWVRIPFLVVKYPETPIILN